MSYTEPKPDERHGIFEEVMTKLFPDKLKDEEQAEGPEMDQSVAVQEGSPLPVTDPLPQDGYDPLAVKVTNPKDIQIVVPKSARDWSANSFIVRTGTPTLIASFNPRRRTVILIHRGVANIAIQSDANVRYAVTGAGNSGGFEMFPSDILSLDVNTEVWAIADPASSGELIGVIQLFDEGGV